MGRPHIVLVVVMKNGSVTVLFGAMIVLMIVEVWVLSNTDVVHISGGIRFEQLDFPPFELPRVRLFK